MNDQQFVTGSELARIAKVNRSAVSRLASRGRLPVGSDGLFDLNNIDVRAYIEFPSEQRRQARREREQNWQKIESITEQSISAVPKAETVIKPDIDISSPLVLDTLDALSHPERIERVDRFAAVALVQALHSRIIISPEGENDMIIDGFKLREEINGIFLDWCKSYLGTDLKAVLAEIG